MTQNAFPSRKNQYPAPIVAVRSGDDEPTVATIWPVRSRNVVNTYASLITIGISDRHVQEIDVIKDVTAGLNPLSRKLVWHAIGRIAGAHCLRASLIRIPSSKAPSERERRRRPKTEFKRRVDGIPFDLALELSDLLREPAS